MLYSLVFTASIISSKVFGAEFEYPENNWDEVSTAPYPNYCGTSHSFQSPINIDTTTVNTELGKDKTLDWKLGEFENFKVWNTGHNLKIQPVISSSGDGDDDSSSSFGKLQNQWIKFSGQNTEFCLDSFHIHWGMSDGTGSEHRVNGVQSEMEMHFVHYSCEYESVSGALSAYETIKSDTTKDQYTLGVVSVLFSVGEENEFFSKILEKRASLQSPSESGVSISGADISKIIPSEDERAYYHYRGSLTTPPCTPIVGWHVFEKQMTLSEAQLVQLRTMLNEHHTLSAPNYRETQSNTNTVYKCQSNDD